MVYPTELVEVITVGVVKIVGWCEYDGCGRGSWKVHVWEGLRSGCGRGVEFSKAQRAKARKVLTVTISGSLSENFIKGIAALAIKEIGVHAQLVQGVPSTRVPA